MQAIDLAEDPLKFAYEIPGTKPFGRLLYAVNWDSF